MKIRRVVGFPLFIFALILAGNFPAFAQVMGPSQIDFANLREDVRMLSQKVGELSLTVEQLQRDNNEMKSRAGQSVGNYVTLSQLNQAVADLNRTFQSALADQKQSTLQQVGVQLEKLAKQTQAALDGVNKSGSSLSGTKSTGSGGFSDDFSREGVNYTVQKGDTIALIAKKNNANGRDIINANKISDPAKIVVGQTLFIPKKKD
ncbi:MAG TPA: LysM peptidoglycan-binding domain-containing protein [Opitutaceae bacterium]|nr:LysM peptidoglycan-binding domain-containing protein [Opitutaceae bacterium]